MVHQTSSGRFCRLCGTPITKGPKYKYCSTECQKTARSNRLTEKLEAMTEEQREAFISARRAKGRAGYHKNREQAFQYAQENKERRSRDAKARHQALRAEVITAYGSQCACCGESTPVFLSIDHTNGDGAEHRRQLKEQGTFAGAGVGLYRWLRSNGYPDGFRLLCHNCNMSRGFYGYCPYVKESDVPA